MKKRTATITSIVILLIMALGVTAWFIVQNNTQQSVNNTSTTQSEPVDRESISEPSSEEPQQPTEQTTLSAVGDYIGYGTATRTTSGEFVHTVTAMLDDPAEGKFYEGWLVNAPDFFSTGKMTKETNGTWSLTYTSDSPQPDYREVVITEEISANGLDNIPEAHVLEGTF